VGAVMVDQQIARDRDQPGAERAAPRIEPVPCRQGPFEALLREILGVGPAVEPVGEESVDAPQVIVVCLFEVQEGERYPEPRDGRDWSGLSVSTGLSRIDVRRSEASCVGPSPDVANRTGGLEVRKLTVAAVLVASMTLSLGAASAAGPIITPIKVTARVLPKHINHGKYIWHTTGTIILPPQVCPFGTTDPRYCLPTTPADCAGTMSLIVKVGKDKLLADSGRQIGRQFTKTVGCNYSFRTFVKRSVYTAKHPLAHDAPIRHTTLILYARFLGNTLVFPKSARVQRVIGKVLAPKP
jgi:hypothetical protein